MLKQFIKSWWSWHRGFLGNNRGNIGKMFTPPKSKSPWEAMTQGSTGGWAKWAEPLGPVLTTAMGALAPVTSGLSLLGSAAMGAAGMAGGKTGFRGTDYGNANWGSTLGGAALGLGEGVLGSGIAGGFAGASGSAPAGMFSGGASSMPLYGGAPAITGTSALGGAAAGQGIGSTMLGSFGSGFGLGTSSAMGQIGGAMSSVMKPFAGLLSGGGTTTGTGAAGAGAGAGGAGGSALDFLKNPMQLLGLGLTALSQAPISSKPPSIGNVASKWLTTDAITKSGQLAKDIATTEYIGDFAVDKETQAFMQVSQKEIEKSYKVRSENLDKMAKATNQQWMNSGERLEMHRRLEEEMTNEVDQMRAQWLFAAKQTYSKNKYDYVMESIKVDDATKRELLYADMEDIRLKYGLEEQAIVDLRTLARDSGIYLTTGGA